MAGGGGSLVGRAWSGFWRGVDAVRRVVINIIFLGVVGILIGAFWAGSSGRPKLQDDTALVVAIKGDIVEEYTGSAREAEVAEALGGEALETQLRDLIEGIDAAARDPKITRMLLLLEDMDHAGLAKLREVAAVLERFKAAGKPIVAWGPNLDQRHYYLAAHANEAYVHPFGAVVLTGFGGYRAYYHDALERLGVTVNVFRVGKFKSFVEPFVGNGPSKEAMEADEAWLNDAWDGFTAEVEAARHLPAGTLAALIAQTPARLAANGGDPARLALEEKLVDGLKTRDEIRALMTERGKPDHVHKTFRQVSLDEYRARLTEVGDRTRQVGIVVAAGSISDGTEPQGSIGGRSTAELIRRARDDDAIKALVLRVDSPGGSAFGSELIRHELELTRKAGKPVVVSMSDVAASGGYWISTSADRVVADPGTITGSIGVFGLFPTAERGLEKIGVHTGGATTTWAAGAIDFRRPIDGRLASVMQSTVEHVYREFLTRVADAHQSTPDKVDLIAQGRVWTGRQAKERGLVDELGGLALAVNDAAKLAKLGDGYRLSYVEAEPRGWGRILAGLPGALLHTSALQMLLQAVAPEGARAAGQHVTSLEHDLDLLLAPATQGRTLAYVHCLCSAP